MSDTKPRIFTQSFASVYPAYVQKAEKKGRSKREVDKIIRWLTGYSQRQLNAKLKAETDFETFFGKAPSSTPTVGSSPASSAGCVSRTSRTR